MSRRGVAVRLLRHIAGQTPFGVFGNVFDHEDREKCGGWYVNLHVYRWRLEVYEVQRYEEE